MPLKTFYAILKFNIQESKAVFEEIFNGPTHVFVASFVLKLFTCLLENSQHEQTIAIEKVIINEQFCLYLPRWV